MATNWPGHSARNGVFHADWLVVIVDGGGDFFGLALGARIESADHALEFGEFFDQFCREVGLGKKRGSFSVGVSAEFFREQHNALGFLRD